MADLIIRGGTVLDGSGAEPIAADVAITDDEVRLRFHRRAHLPIVLASGLFDKPLPVPWWNGRFLRLIE